MLLATTISNRENWQCQAPKNLHQQIAGGLALFRMECIHRHAVGHETKASGNEAKRTDCSLRHSLIRLQAELDHITTRAPEDSTSAHGLRT